MNIIDSNGGNTTLFAIIFAQTVTPATDGCRIGYIRAGQYKKPRQGRGQQCIAAELKLLT
ncbi:MAG: hypothetical protein H6985_01970 [Pseudomonadales bacterium]|nr:hypothetical protein [Pseudomonadales bacterium]